MSGLGYFILVLVVPVAALIGFWCLDNWRKRKAWRDANHHALEYMKMRYGTCATCEGAGSIHYCGMGACVDKVCTSCGGRGWKSP